MRQRQGQVRRECLCCLGCVVQWARLLHSSLEQTGAPEPDWEPCDREAGHTSSPAALAPFCSTLPCIPLCSLVARSDAGGSSPYTGTGP